MTIKYVTAKHLEFMFQYYLFNLNTAVVYGKGLNIDLKGEIINWYYNPYNVSIPKIIVRTIIYYEMLSYEL